MDAWFSSPPSADLLTLGSFTIRWYGFLLALGAGLGMMLTLRLVRRARLTLETTFDVLLWTTVIGFLGARLYHVLNEPGYYAANPGEILKLWHGGLAIHGGLLFGGLAFFFLARRAKLPLGRLADCVAPGLLLAQAIGRWGNFFNQELFGRPTGLPWGIPIDPAFRPIDALTSSHFHPVFFYESAFDFLGVLLLLWVYKRIKQSPKTKWRDGRIFFLYLLLAGTGRIIAELFRTDPTPDVVGIRLPLFVSGLLISAGLAGLWRLRQKASQITLK